MVRRPGKHVLLQTRGGVASVPAPNLSRLTQRTASIAIEERGLNRCGVKFLAVGVGQIGPTEGLASRTVAAGSSQLSTRFFPAMVMVAFDELGEDKKVTEDMAEVERKAAEGKDRGRTLNWRRQ